MSVVRIKTGVEFTTIAPAGFRILSAIDQVAKTWGKDITITSACDGLHSGISDPHHSGEAYDIRTQDMPPGAKETFLADMMAILGWDSFYGFVEDPGTDNEHIHCQRKKGTTYP